jgi:hypothetical protein
MTNTSCAGSIVHARVRAGDPCGRPRLASSLACAALLCMAAMPARALIVTIDEFAIVRNGVPYFRDTFSDGSPPSSAPNFANGTLASYAVSGSLAGQEFNDRLRLDSTTGLPGVDALGNPTRDLTVRLLTNNDPALPNALKPAASFQAAALFDLPAVFTPSSSFQLRLWERDTSLPAGLTLALTQIRVNRGGGAPAVQFRQQDFVAGSVDLRNSVPLDLSGNPDQMLLVLAWDPALQRVFAGYQYLSGGQLLGDAVALGDAPLFTRWGSVQAGFSVNEGLSPTVVPLPASALLVGPGMLSLLAFARHGRRPAG